MHFLFPGFLFALAAVSIPVIIHLFNLRKFKKVYFSNVSFLKEIDQKSSSRRKLKNRLVLAARVLAIIFLVLAFAKPYLPGKEAEVAGTRIISVYLDNSYSMEAVNKEGSLLVEAKRRAGEVAASYSLNDKFRLITNDFEGGSRRLLSHEDFLNAVEQVKISSFTRKLSEVTAMQEQVVSGERAIGKEIFLISDFQKNMISRTAPVQTDSNSRIRLIRAQANRLANISVDSVWFASPVHKPAAPEQLIVRLSNNSDEKAEDVPIKVLINGRQKGIGSISLGARESAKDTLNFSGLSAGWQQGEVQITDYPVVFDDRFYFSFYVRPYMKVLSINDSNPNSYLQAVYQTDPFFKLSNTTTGNINYSALTDYPLIILNSLNLVSPGLTARLREYVKQGGSLMIFPSLNGDLSSLSGLLRALNTDTPREIVISPSRISGVDLHHPVFNGVFERIPKNMDLPVVKKYIRYSRLSHTDRETLLRMRDGSSFLSEYKLGKGKVFLFASPPDEDAGNLVRHALFVPLMFQTAFLSLGDGRLFYVSGRDQFLESSRIFLPDNQVLKLKKGRFETIPDLRQTGTSSRLFIGDQVQEPGNYQLFKGDSLLSVIAFNSNRSESDLSYADNEEILSQFEGPKPQILTPGRGSVQNAVKAADYGAQIWKLCIILALLCLAAEVLLIRFYKISEQ